jgi:hypothetical protein
MNLPAARAEFGDRVDRLGAYLARADPLADEAVAVASRMPEGTGWSALFRMLGADAPNMPAPRHMPSPRSEARRDAPEISHVPEAWGAFLRETSRVPAWVDWDLVQRGGRVLVRAGPLGGLVLGLKSLVLAYASPGGNKPLVRTGQLVEHAAMRLHETARFVGATVTEAGGGLRPGSPGWQITLRVRLVHARIRRTILESGRWDAAAWGAPINQHDQVGTLILFSVAVLEGLRHLGMTITAEEAEAYMHLWRWSGWLVGVDPELLPATEREGARLGALIRATQGPPDDDSRALTRALLFSAPRGAGLRREGRVPVVSAALCRTLIGDDLADALAVPRTPWQRAVPAVRRLVSALDFATKAVPGGPDFALDRGRRYWERVEAQPGSRPSASTSS